MNPLDLLYSWQSMFLAVVIATMTQSAKRMVEGLLERKTGMNGEVVRKASVVNTALFPLLPLVLGGVFGWLVPLRPEYLVRYVTDNHINPVVYAMWGASVGQFADYLYQRAKTFMAPNTTVPTPEEPKPEEPKPEEPKPPKAQKKTCA